MKIALISDTFLPQINGVAAQVFYLADSLAKLGHEVLVITASKNIPQQKCSKFEIVNLLSMPTLIYQGERLAMPTGKVYRSLKKFRPDLVHVHTPFLVGAEGILAAKILKIPLVGTHHTFYDTYLEHVKLDYKWTNAMCWKYTVGFYNKCDLVILPSQPMLQAICGHGLKVPALVLANGVNTEIFKPISPLAIPALKNKFGLGTSKSVIYMGRLSYEKSIEVLLQAFKLVAEALPDVKFHLVGDGPNKNNLIKMALNLGIADKTIFSGVLTGTDLVEALQANDIFATASKTEVLPVSVIEAMAVGLPIVGVAENGVGALINHGLNGFAVPADDIVELSKKIIWLLNENSLRSKMGIVSRQMVEQNYSNQIGARLVELYQQVI